MTAQVGDVNRHVLRLPPKLGLNNRALLRAGLSGLEPFVVPSKLETKRPEQADALLAWGWKNSAKKALHLARKHQMPVIRVEDAFIRSVYFGPGEPALGLVFDDLGVYYNTRSPSRLERLIHRELDGLEVQRARNLLRLWRQGRVSKYNHAREYHGELPEQYILVVDQTRGDLSIACGGANPSSFRSMLDAALDENPGYTVLIKLHPEVMAGKKEGHFDLGLLAKLPRVRLLGEDVHPARLIERAAAVYTVTSQMGFEALIWQKEVRTFGTPFYAGWGLTTDEARRPGVTSKASLEQLIYAALVDYPRYVDPETLLQCPVERVLEHIALQREMLDRFPEHLYATGLPRWKHFHVRRFFPYSKIKFVRSPRQVPAGATVLRWGRSPGEVAPPPNVRTFQLEDGFIRSVGLGASFATPSSWVADPCGIYFDASGPSQLETILETEEFEPSLLERARVLIEALVAEGVTKYNVGRAPWTRPAMSADIVLVPGQVESDASILYGSPFVRTNLALLRAVRASSPGSYLVYKPHPDVAAGLRRPGDSEFACKQWCDQVVDDAPMGRLLEIVDEVHTMTSLAGFEALLRGKKVVTYGQPFYAGWGLTEDRIPLTRRTRKLTLEELVAGALFLYPLYISGTTGRYTSPERALHELLSGRKPVIAKNHLESLLRSMIDFPLWRKLVAR